MTRSYLLALLACTVSPRSPLPEESPAPAGPEPVPPIVSDIVERREQAVIDVVFVLDTTGSMSSLIEGAKQKIWAIANAIATAQPTPRIRMGLVAYRDRGGTPTSRR